jgi:aminoglycoside phosphotransferase (APT) family kinase protein
LVAAHWADELAAKLRQRVDSMHLLPGGASKEAWAVEAGGERLLVRRALGGVIHEGTLPLENEFQVLEAAVEAGVKVPRPVAYLGELGGREAFAMELVEGETIGRRIVRDPPTGLELELAEELAKIHAIPLERLPFLRSGDVIERFEDELDSVGDPRAAIEYGLWWLREHRPEPLADVVSHGDFRIGNVVVSERGLEYILDWEFAHLSDPREDVAWPLVRAWRFGADDRRLGGVGEVGPYLERYEELTGRSISERDLDWWEVLGNVKWAIGCLTQCRRHLTGLDRSIEYAVLGRMAAEMEYELLDLIDKATLAAPTSGRAGLPARPSAPPARSAEIQREGVTRDRPNAFELIEAVTEFLSSEVLPAATDHRFKFRTLVALNALGIAYRELQSSEDLVLDQEELAELARRIRAGDVDEDLHGRLKEHVAAKLRISNPAYLERYD